MAGLTIDGVTKVFGEDDGDEVVAVDGVSIDIADGEFLVLVGPSGCGKSTTLRMIAGLETVTDGTIALGGDVLNDVKPQHRDIAMVFQSYALYPHLSARRNMSFGLEQSTDLPKAEIAERVEEVAAMMGIEDLLGRKPGQLSGGQQQRVALGRSIVRDPEVFLMDEPLSNLDAKLRAEMRTELQQLQSQLGVTTVYVTHDQTEAMTMGDRIAVMDDGRLQQHGEPLELYHEPANLFVAEFIGEPAMNLLDGAYADGAFTADRFDYRFDDEIAAAIADGTGAGGAGGTGSQVVPVVLGVRPEDVAVEPAGSHAGTHDGSRAGTHDRDHASGGVHTYEMTATVVEPMGNENVVHLEFIGESGETAGAEDLVAVTPGTQRVEEGSTVAVHVPVDAVHVFDADTGEALHNRRLEHTRLTAPQ